MGAVAVVGPEVVFVVVLVVEPGVVSVAIVPVADVAGPQASGGIAPAFDALVPVFVAAGEVDSSERSRFRVFPNIGFYSRFSSSFEVVVEESVDSSTGVHTNCGLCSILSNPGQRHNKKLAHFHNKPNSRHKNTSDTNDRSRDATTNHPRKTYHRLYQEQRTHSSYQASRSHPEAPQMR